MKHQIDLESLNNWVKGARLEFASSHGKCQNKNLFCTLRGTYEVWHKSELVLETSIRSRAVNKYNEL